MTWPGRQPPALGQTGSSQKVCVGHRTEVGPKEMPEGQRVKSRQRPRNWPNDGHTKEWGSWKVFEALTIKAFASILQTHTRSRVYMHRKWTFQLLFNMPHTHTLSHAPEKPLVSQVRSATGRKSFGLICTYIKVLYFIADPLQADTTPTQTSKLINMHGHTSWDMT